jgi:cytochrome c
MIAIAAAFAPALAAASWPTGRSPDTGERAFQKCYSCHALEPGRNDLEGPTLHGIVGRPVGAEPDFEYSPALKLFAERNPLWTEELLDRLIAEPEGLLPGTTMAFAGIRDPAERAALVDYLRRLPKGSPPTNG